MKKLILCGVAAFAVGAAPASAATFLTVVNSSPAVCTAQTPICNFDVDGEVGFNGVFSLVSNAFSFPGPGESTGSLTNSQATISANSGTNIDFNDVYIRSTTNPALRYFFTINNGDVVSRGTLDSQVLGGTYELVINGIAQTYAGPPAPSFPRIGGDITFVAGVVPEPATWALFILGFGAIGATLRRRGSAVRMNKAKLHFA